MGGTMKISSNLSSFALTSRFLMPQFFQKEGKCVKKALFLGIMTAALGYSTTTFGMDFTKDGPEYFNATKLTRPSFTFNLENYEVPKEIMELLVVCGKISPTLAFGCTQFSLENANRQKCLKGLEKVAELGFPGHKFSEVDFTKAYTYLTLPSEDGEHNDFLKKCMATGSLEERNNILMIINATIEFSEELIKRPNKAPKFRDLITDSTVENNFFQMTEEALKKQLADAQALNHQLKVRKASEQTLVSAPRPLNKTHANLINKLSKRNKEKRNAYFPPQTKPIPTSPKQNQKPENSCAKTIYQPQEKKAIAKEGAKGAVKNTVVKNESTQPLPLLHIETEMEKETESLNDKALPPSDKKSLAEASASIDARRDLEKWIDSQNFKRKPTPKYEEIERTNSPHKLRITYRVSLVLKLDNKKITKVGMGVGETVKGAKDKASQDLLSQLTGKVLRKKTKKPIPSENDKSNSLAVNNKDKVVSVHTPMDIYNRSLTYDVEVPEEILSNLSKPKKEKPLRRKQKKIDESSSFNPIKTNEPKDPGHLVDSVIANNNQESSDINKLQSWETALATKPSVPRWESVTQVLSNTKCQQNNKSSLAKQKNKNKKYGPLKKPSITNFFTQSQQITKVFSQEARMFRDPYFMSWKPLPSGVPLPPVYQKTESHILVPFYPKRGAYNLLPQTITQQTIEEIKASSIPSKEKSSVLSQVNSVRKRPRSVSAPSQFIRIRKVEQRENVCSRES
jgi:hypothetical protein